MYRKLLTRTLVLLMIAVLGYFAFISGDVTQEVPIEKSSEQSGMITEDTMLGTDAHYKSFNPRGDVISTGSSMKVTIEGESLRLEDGLELETYEIGGKKYSVKADSFGVGSENQRILTAEPGHKIILTGEDVSIETVGPLAYDNLKSIFSTEARAYYKMGDAHGQSEGLRYKPDVFLELQGDCIFNSHSNTEKSTITADHLFFRNEEARGLIRNGVITTVSLDGEKRTRLDAREIAITYKGGKRGEPFLLEQATMNGLPARFTWNNGEMTSSFFEACFDPSGKWVEEMLTGADAHFTAETQDGYHLFGRGGQLSLLMEQSVPRELLGHEPVEIEGAREEGPVLRLIGKSGLETQFIKGQAYSTRLFGKPRFSYGGQEGEAGHIRVSHNERNIIFSGGAELLDGEQQVRIKADEILLSNWDQEEKEINAFKFVEITYREDASDIAQCFGEELKFLLPQNYIKLKGSPAQVNRQNLTIDANTIEMDRIDELSFDLKANSTTNNEVNLLMATDEGASHIQARSLVYTGETDLLVFDNVIKAVFPKKGQLFCKQMRVKLKNRGEAKVVETIEAEEDVLFEGALEDRGEVKPVNCRADQLRYNQSEGLIYFIGKGKNLVFNHPTGVFEGRELTYNLKNGTIRGDSEKHGTTVTRIKIDERNNNDQ